MRRTVPPGILLSSGATATALRETRAFSDALGDSGRMRPARLLLLAALLAHGCSSAEPPTPTEPVAVFAASVNLAHAAVRIPALLMTRQGTLLAVAEGRTHASDQAGNDLVLSRSTDDGATWSAPRVIRDMEADALNNPCLVQDAASGRVFLFHQLFPAGKSEFGTLEPGPLGTVRLHEIHSDDDGVSWSKPRDLSAELKPADALTAASGPGIGIQLQHGPARGRLVIPFNSQSAGRHFVNWMAVSDDGGATWRRGENVPCADAELNEVQVAETTDGAVVLNSRHWRGTNRGRLMARSADGGLTWNFAYAIPALPEPVCQASLLAAGDRILFLNPAGEPAGRGRRRGVLRISEDDGHTWPGEVVLVPGPFAYSSMALLSNGDLGVLYEPAGSSQVLFLRTSIPSPVEQP